MPSDDTDLSRLHLTPDAEAAFARVRDTATDVDRATAFSPAMEELVAAGLVISTHAGTILVPVGLTAAS